MAKTKLLFEDTENEYDVSKEGCFKFRLLDVYHVVKVTHRNYFDVLFYRFHYIVA